MLLIMNLWLIMVELLILVIYKSHNNFKIIFKIIASFKIVEWIQTTVTLIWPPEARYHRHLTARCPRSQTISSARRIWMTKKIASLRSFRLRQACWNSWATSSHPNPVHTYHRFNPSIRVGRQPSWRANLRQQCKCKVAHHHRSASTKCSKTILWM